MVATPQIGRKLARKRIRKSIGDTPLTEGQSAQQALTPAQIMAQWEAEGVIGAWRDRADITDSSEYARELRAKAERREWD